MGRPARLLGPQLLLLAAQVVGDDGVSRLQDQLRAPVVPLQLHHGRTGLVALEVEDVAEVRPAPGVDRLVVVADHAQVVVRGGERPDDPVLGAVRVLVFVHVEIAPARLVAGEHLRLRLEEQDRPAEQVVEVERASLAEAPLVGHGELRDVLLVAGRGRLFECVGTLQVVLRPGQRLEHAAGPDRAALERHVEVAEDLLHQRQLVVRVVDHEARIEPDRHPVPAQHPGADRVEGAHLHLPAIVRANQRHDPLAHLRSSLVRERHGQDPPGRHAGDADQVGDAMRHDPGLATPGAGEDEERPIRRRDSAGLFGVQPRRDRRGQLLA